MANFLSVSEICRIIPPGRNGARTNPSTISRWIQVGTIAADGERVRLRAKRAGCRWIVSPEDLDAFLTRCAAQPEATEAATRTPTARNKANETAKKRLAEIGI